MIAPPRRLIVRPIQRTRAVVVPRPARRKMNFADESLAKN
jgi:hypothetical protein